VEGAFACLSWRDANVPPSLPGAPCGGPCLKATPFTTLWQILPLRRLPTLGGVVIARTGIAVSQETFSGSCFCGVEKFNNP